MNKQVCYRVFLGLVLVGFMSWVIYQVMRAEPNIWINLIALFIWCLWILPTMAKVVRGTPATNERHSSQERKQEVRVH